MTQTCLKELSLRERVLLLLNELAILNEGKISASNPYFSFGVDHGEERI